MGEIADMMINGDLCEGCGVDLGEGDGYPRKCADCNREHGRQRELLLKKDAPKVECPKCHKVVKAVGLQDHMRAVHPNRADSPYGFAHSGIPVDQW